jgi:hypothetical protein
MGAGLDALGASHAVSAQEVVAWCTAAAGPEREQAVCRRVACAVLGVADQRWAAELLRALGEMTQPATAQRVEALRAAAQRGAPPDELARRARQAVAAGVAREDLAAAIAASPHPWMRAVAALVREGGER